MMLGMAGLGEFGALIRRARERNEMTGVELAQKMGKPHSFVVRMEGGKFSNPPDPADFDAFSKALRLSKEEMLRALGYLDEAATDAGDVITVRRADPRAKLLDAVAGMTDDDVVQFTQAMAFLMKAKAKYAPDDIRGGNDDAPGVMSSEGIQRQSNTDSA
jgi:transcriptional regulator with XRE-family HTH domain